MMLMRTILNIPANSPKMLLNANVMGAYVILFDLEDGVAPGQKPFARELLCAYLRRGLFQGQAMVRVNDWKQQNNKKEKNNHGSEFERQKLFDADGFYAGGDPVCG